MVRVLRVCYFLDGDILNVIFKKKLLYVWKLIFYGKELIVKGIRYIIGNGKLIKMWIDLWFSIYF